MNSKLTKNKTKRVYLTGDKGYMLLREKKAKLIKNKNIQKEEQKEK